MTKIEKFVEEYAKLVEKHGITFMTYPVYVPDEVNGGFKTVIQTVPVEKPNDEKFIQEN